MVGARDHEQNCLAMLRRFVHPNSLSPCRNASGRLALREVDEHANTTHALTLLRADRRLGIVQLIGEVGLIAVEQYADCVG
jgi:hypothetical protein